MNAGELRLRRQALRQSPAAIRHALIAFLNALEIDGDAQIDIVTAVGEALANAVEHAYPGSEVGELELEAAAAGGTLSVCVADRGAFGPPREGGERGFGLRIIRAIARSVQVDTGAGGTTVRMVFGGV